MKRILMSIVFLIMVCVLSAGAEYSEGLFRYVFAEDSIYQDGEGVIIVRYTGRDRHVTIPASLGGEPVIGLDGLAFYQKERLEWVSIPSTVKKIGPYIFTACPNLREIVFLGNAPTIYMTPLFDGSPEISITYMAGNQGFSNPWKGYPTVESFVAPPDFSNPIASGDWKYSVSAGCAVLIEYIGQDTIVSVPSSLDGYPVTRISSQTFDHSYTWDTMIPAIERLAIAPSVRILDPHVFGKLLWMHEVAIGDGVVSIPSHAFDGCSSLETIHFGTAVREIGDSAFANCNMLEEVFLPPSVERIGSEAFAHNENLHKVVVGNNVSEIGPRAFFNCENLTEIRFLGKAPVVGVSAFPQQSDNFFVSYNGKYSGFPSLWQGVRTKPYYQVFYTLPDFSGRGKSLVTTDTHYYFPGNEVVVQGPPSDRMQREFLGWDTRQDGTGIRLEEGDLHILGNGDLRLYAMYGEILDRDDSDDKGRITELVVGTRAWTGLWETDWGAYRISQSGNNMFGVDVDDMHAYIQGTVSGDVVEGTYGEVVQDKCKVFGNFSFHRTSNNAFQGFRSERPGLPKAMWEEWNGVRLDP